jgi:hypothetical protein
VWIERSLKSANQISKTRSLDGSRGWIIVYLGSIGAIAPSRRIFREKSDASLHLAVQVEVKMLIVVVGSRMTAGCQSVQMQGAFQVGTEFVHQVAD